MVSAASRVIHEPESVSLRTSKPAAVTSRSNIARCDSDAITTATLPASSASLR